jgi:hypothetical protein
MPQSVTLATATFEEIWWNSKGQRLDSSPAGNPPLIFQVQFNPQSLKLNYSNQKAGGDQPKGSSTQFVGRAVTKLGMELWFDIALAQATVQSQSQTNAANDVQQLTQKVAYFLVPQTVPGSGTNTTLPPPGLKITWGSFSFAGVMDSMDETLDFFSADGHPLRSQVSISLTKQEISYNANTAATAQNPQSAGIQPYTPVKKNDTFQQMAANAGSSAEPGAPGWQALALANGIENPRLMAAGALVNFSAGASASASAQLGVTAQTSGPLSLNLGASGGASGGVSLGFVGATTTNGNGGAGLQASASFSIGS